MNNKITQQKIKSNKSEQIPHIILASGSKNRQQALEIAKIPYIVAVSNIDEKSIQHPDIYKRVILVAKAKVKSVEAHYSGIILGADGINICKGKVLEKPQNKQEAISMLQLQSGQTCSFITGFYLLNTKTKHSHSGTSETIYKFRILSDQEIKFYIEHEPVLTWAGAFSPGNSRAIAFIESIDGSYANFTYSMPFEKLIPIFQLENLLW